MWWCNQGSVYNCFALYRNRQSGNSGERCNAVGYNIACIVLNGSRLAWLWESENNGKQCDDSCASYGCICATDETGMGMLYHNTFYTRRMTSKYALKQELRHV